MDNNSYNAHRFILSKWISGLLITVFVLFATAGGLQAQEYSVKISPSDTTLEVGSEAQFEAFLVDTSGNKTDTTFTWSVADTTLGDIDSTGAFTAQAEGKTSVKASLDTLSGSAEVEIESGEEEDNEFTLTVTPSDTTVSVDSTVQFNATLRDTSGSAIDTTVSWSVRGNNAGTVDSTGLFTATNAGLSLVIAEVGDQSASATVIVQDFTSDTTGTQTVTVIKPRPSPAAPLDTTVIKEGETYKLSGFPFPLNLLNGGLVHFPHGSLKEDISLKIDMPSFAEITGDSVKFEGDIITAAAFHVMIDDSVHSPYHFRQSIIVSLPYKRGLIHNVLGITPDQIGMFFYNTETGKDSTGISTALVDSSSNRIFASVAHFSNLVLAPSETTTPIPDEEKKEVNPASFKLSQNYPNPFNPTTTIAYSLPEAAQVELEVYNMLGKRVATLVDRRQQSGRHTVQFNAADLSSGVYMYRIKAGTHTAIRKMTLIK